MHTGTTGVLAIQAMATTKITKLQKNHAAGNSIRDNSNSNSNAIGNTYKNMKSCHSPLQTIVENTWRANWKVKLSFSFGTHCVLIKQICHSAD